MMFSNETVLLADVINYSLKGLTGAIGKGEGITKCMQPLSFHVREGCVLSDFIYSITSTNLLDDGDAIVIPSKVIAIIEKRFVYGLTIDNYDRCIRDIVYARQHLKTADNKPLTSKDLIGLDKIDPAREIGSRYPENPNQSAYQIAKSIKEKVGIRVDVVITDSDSGGKKGINLIACPTVISTPIGATRGLRFFYCMRLSVAAEVTWNNKKNIPVLLVKPHKDHDYRLRKFIGEIRYPGFLNAKKEDDVINALNN